MSDHGSTPRQAASVLLLREGASGGPPEVYMLRRHPKSEFMSEAYVFPGGAVDPEDNDPAFEPLCPNLSAQEAGHRMGLDDAATAMAHHVACARETFEEAGLLLCVGAAPGAHTLKEMRAALNAGERTLQPLLVKYGVALALSQLRVLDHWVTPVISPRRFDAWFFIARAPAGQRASFNPGESTDGRWLSADQALQDAAAGQVMLAPPTICQLQDLSAHATVDQALAAAPNEPPPAKMPQVLLDGELPTLLFVGDHRHDQSTGQPGDLDYVHMRDGRWQRVRETR